LVTDIVGVTDPRGVVTGPFGAFFGSKKGLYQLDRAMTVAYQGSEAETTWQTNPQITAAIKSDTESTLYFGANPSGVTPGVRIVHDYVLDIWSVDTVREPAIVGQNACITAGCEVDGSMFFGTSSGCVFFEDYDVNDDFSADKYSTTIDTPWIHVGNIAGFQRVWRTTLTGTQYKPSQFSISFAYDYVETYETARTWTSTDLSGLTRVQVSAKPTKQKVEAIKVRIIGSLAAGDAVTEAPAFGFSSLTLELGVKSSAKRLPATSRK
jgi:hypothetical protein